MAGWSSGRWKKWATDGAALRETADALARLNVLNQGALLGLRKDSFDPRKFFGPCWRSPQTPDTTTLAAWIRDLKA
ncbi:hypothetical protein E5D57_001904 [Metarhizium anisopliae]|nr:hypothetical protein E5D57_001904 [Metarhizium anisopliae]